MRSSAKITLFLGQQASVNGHSLESHEVQSGWTCGVCGYVNSLSSSDSARSVETRCGLCGVRFLTSRSSSSLPPTRTGTPAPATSPRVIVDDPDGRIPCPACTFLNHKSMASCEMCSTPLPGGKKLPSTMRPVNGEEELDLVRLSFRKGGEKEAYRRMKNVLGGRAWERGVCSYVDRSFNC